MNIFVLLLTQQINCLIPDFNAQGLLPVGIHWSDIGQVKDKLGFSAKRQKLILGLERALIAFKHAGCETIYIDGSFVTSKLEPGDIDCCWEIAGVDPTKLDPVLLDFHNERAAQKKKFGCEFFMSHWIAIKPPPITYLDFFQKDKEFGKPKGIIGIKL